MDRASAYGAESRGFESLQAQPVKKGDPSKWIVFFIASFPPHAPNNSLLTGIKIFARNNLIFDGERHRLSTADGTQLGEDIADMIFDG